MQSEVDKLDVHNLVLVPTDLSKISNVLRSEVVKKDVYDEIVRKVNALILLNLLKDILWC